LAYKSYAIITVSGIELLVDVGVAVAIKFADMGVRPSAVVDSSPSDLDLVVSCSPSRNLSVVEDSPTRSKTVSLFESSVHNNVLGIPIAVFPDDNVVNSLSEAIRGSSSNEINSILSS